MKKKGFTLIELLLVTVIIGIIASLALPAFSRLRKGARATQAANECDTLAAAVRSYYHEYGRYPFDDKDISGGVMTFKGNNNTIINYLTSYDAEKNFRKVQFLNRSDYKFNSSDAVVDPLGYPYVFAIDVDNDTISVSLDSASKVNK